MSRAFLSGLRSLAYADPVFRNIVSLRQSVDLFDDLSDEPADQAIAAAAEQAHKPATYGSHEAVINRPFDEAAWMSVIGFPFLHWSESRYSNGSYGVWYGADSIGTTVYETAYHWRNGLLADAEGFLRPGVVVERSLYRVRLDALLLDFRPEIEAFPVLIDPDDYQFTQQIGAQFSRQRLPGLVSRSARCEGDVFAIFSPDFLSRPQQIAYLTYRTVDGGVEVERSPGRIWLRIRHSAG